MEIVKFENHNQEAVVHSYLSGLDIAGKTKENYLGVLSAFLSWYGREGQRMSENILIRYKEHLQGQHKPLTVNFHLVPVRSFLNFLHDKNIIPFKPSVRLLPRPNGHLRDAFSVDQVKAILGDIPLDTLEGLRNYAIINLMARTGLRVKEIINADIEDIRTRNNKTVLYVLGKYRAQKDEFVVLNNRAYDPIREYLAAREYSKGKSPLFSVHSNRNLNGKMSSRTVRHMIQGYIKLAGIKNGKLSAHSFRHFCASESLAAGADLVSVSRMLRHRDIRTSQVYLHYKNRTDNPAEERIVF